MKAITSIQNPLIKNLLQLQEKSRARKKTGSFIIEGKREIGLAIEGGYKIQTLLFCSDILSENETRQTPAEEYIEIDISVYQKLAYRDSTEGLIAVAVAKNHDLQSLNVKPNGLYLVCESIEKPGNIGALLRTADAANIDGFIIANPKTDLYNPNVIRSSVGCVFTNSIATGTTEEVIKFLKANNINSYGASLQHSTPYHTQDYTGATALVVGTEATGLSDKFKAATTQNIIIPMQGKIDSMNVSVAAAILLFEAKRQRGFGNLA
ncbi:MAG: RNA methyltransferase [Flavobacteriales bacterium]|nr:RNA methyltransferase [Flavobacteriales bacterium]